MFTLETPVETFLLVMVQEGYYTTDGEGYPMMVIAKDILNDYEYLQITASHMSFIMPFKV